MVPCTGNPAEMGAWLVLNLRLGLLVRALGWEGTRPRGYPEANPHLGVCPSAASPAWAFPAAGSSVCKTDGPCLVLRQLLSCCCVVLGTRKETAVFLESRGEEGSS